MLKTSETWSIGRLLACLVVTGLLTVAPLAATTVLRASGMLDVRGGRLIPDAAVAMGPRIVPSGYQISMTGGHGDEVGWPPGVFELGPEQGIADGVAEVLRAVRFQIKHGARVIKMTATAGVLGAEATADARQFSDQEMVAIVEEAARHRLKVAAHAHGLEGIRAAIRAGVASIEHGSQINTEAARDNDRARGLSGAHGMDQHDQLFRHQRHATVGSGEGAADHRPSPQEPTPGDPRRRADRLRNGCGKVYRWGTLIGPPDGLPTSLLQTLHLDRSGNEVTAAPR